MSNGIAIDTNIAIYAFSEGPKCDAAMLVLEAGPLVSVQLLNEFVNVSLRKRRATWPEIAESLAIINTLAGGIRAVDAEMHRLGRTIAQSYRLGIYDALIIAAALLDGCDSLFSEDMQHGLVVDGKLTIINPFLENP